MTPWAFAIAHSVVVSIVDWTGQSACHSLIISEMSGGACGVTFVRSFDEEMVVRAGIIALSVVVHSKLGAGSHASKFISIEVEAFLASGSAAGS